MEKHVKQIENLIAVRDIKKGEVAIARLMRSDISNEQRAVLLGYRARIRLYASRPDEARHDLEEAVSLQQKLLENPDTLCLLADCYLAQFEVATLGFADKSDVRNAQAFYHRLIQNYPEYNNLGWVYYQLGRTALIGDRADLAETYFQKALFTPSRINTLTAYSYERLGFIAYYELRQPRQAHTYLDKAIATYPASEPPLWLVQVYVLRSRVLRDIDLSEAQQSAQTALQIASDNAGQKSLIADALFTVVELFATQSGYEERIIEHLQQYIQIMKAPLGVDVTWSRVYEMLGDAHFSLGSYEQAIAAYENVLVYNPYHPWEESIHYRIARAHYQQQDYSKAVDAINQLLNEKHEVKDYRLYNVLGNAYYALGQFDKAAAAYEIGLNIAPAGVDVQTMYTYYQFSRQKTLPL